MREKYKNPWGNHSGYVYLGRFSNMRTDYDLYAIVNPFQGKPRLYDVSLGARYSNDGSCYYSGSLADIGISRSIAICEAQRRYTQLLLETVNSVL